MSDKRIAMVPCHDCGQEHELSFDHLHCPEDPTQYHEVYGHKRPELAYYACPHCGSVWDDAQKNANLQHGRWV
ncbi:phage terminase large subunit family protein, partial [Pseudomonas aeruginosa]|uniref:phage terminase large subunit family protein n=1 Tax=Pseudomonas aeruginosa TaxID=287 RepID=UPI00300AF2BB